MKMDVWWKEWNGMWKKEKGLWWKRLQGLQDGKEENDYKIWGDQICNIKEKIGKKNQK